MAAASEPLLSVPLPPPFPLGSTVHVPGTGKSGLPSPSGIVHGVQNVGAISVALTDPNTWIRVAEVAVGVLLVIVGVNAMLKGQPAKYARKGAEAAAIL